MAIHGRSKPQPARLPTLSFFCLECFSLGLFRLRLSENAKFQQDDGVI
jgi:hypothetical protein